MLKFERVKRAFAIVQSHGSDAKSFLSKDQHVGSPTDAFREAFRWQQMRRPMALEHASEQNFGLCSHAFYTIGLLLYILYNMLINAQ